MKKLKVIVFIDGSNIYFAQKKLGKWLDWVKVKKFLDKQYHILGYQYYVGIRTHDKKSQLFLKKLKTIGFKVITKPVKVLIDEQGHYIEKANFDVEITGDVLKNLHKVDIVVLFSGDSDFTYLIKLVHEDKKKFYVFSSSRTIAWDLKLKADKYFLLEHMSYLTKQKSFAKL